MLISRNWLQSYFTNELPDAQNIAETLMMHSFEIEEIKHIEGDSIIDIDVLPNRAHDCLSYAGVAREYAVLTGFELIPERYHYHDTTSHDDSAIEVIIDNPHQCYRYMARIINNVVVADSPEWLKVRIESIGQRSINNIVDATNYVMFDLGNPMHAFDADKIVGGITIRNAKEGEVMTTLTGEEVTLMESDLVITDDEGVLALAGVKGGTKAEVTKETKNIIIEVANFNPTTTRITARRTKILTDSSKRFENGITSTLAPQAMEAISRLITDSMPAESLGKIIDVYPVVEEILKVNVNASHVNRLLGLELSIGDIEELFSKMDYQVHTEGEKFKVTIPSNRMDLRIAEDLIEELGRIYGYHNIPSQYVDDFNFSPQVDGLVYVENMLKNYFINNEFSEVKNYSFQKKGDVSLWNPLSSDKGSLRKNLSQQMTLSLEKNIQAMDFLGLDRILQFEIGRVYTKTGEETLCCVAISNKDKKAKKLYGTEQQQLEKVISDINELFSVDIKAVAEEVIMSFSLSQIIDQITIPEHYGDAIYSSNSYGSDAVFHNVSIYPYTTRDVSFWAPEGRSDEQLQAVISSQETLFLKKVFLFDTFSKEGKTSYAYSLVFQSDDSTLTDAQVDKDMENITLALESIGCEIR